MLVCVMVIWMSLILDLLQSEKYFNRIGKDCIPKDMVIFLPCLSQKSSFFILYFRMSIYLAVNDA